MPQLLLFNKPFQVLTQFTSQDTKRTLADFIQQPNFYAAGRLDYDSEGLLILTDNGPLQNYLASPKFKMEKTYWAQVEGAITEEAINRLREGVDLKDGVTRPAKARRIDEPALWERTPPIRERREIPTSWIELKITEGKNRQVRRMTAAVGFPTLRLVRYAIGEWTVADLLPGESRLIEAEFDLPKPRTRPGIKRAQGRSNTGKYSKKRATRR
ncbi:pseudouridine synthase [uncultured Neptuniibacter sp.]|uniref:pseudouridine synthase n=1 Tax=uncultured Neptuniibacter sp. TaxID=502143 RepID=UPI00260BF18D|nr:pseudouridine synthase [uncultured Neptuniibacter sp.]